MDEIGPFHHHLEALTVMATFNNNQQQLLLKEKLDAILG